MRYRRRASPLHAARAVAGGAWCSAVAAAALAAEHPLVLAALAVVVLAGAVGAGVGREVGRIVAWMVPWAVVIAFVNMLVVRDGLTVLARLGEVPPFGQVDLTLEALVYGALFGTRLLLVAAAFAVFTVAVDPDDLLRVMRRASVRSALAATLAVRLVPVLAADARADRRGAPLPGRRRRRGRGRAPGGPARGGRRRAGPGAGRRRDAGGPRLRVRAPAGRALRTAVVAPRPGVPGQRGGDRGADDRGARGRLRRRSGPTRSCTPVGWTRSSP